MRVAVGFILVLVAALSSAPVYAVSVEQVPNPRDSNAWVSDTIDALDAQAERRINTQLDALERETSAEIAVVTVEQVDTPTPKDFATELFNHWGIGKADSNNGLLVLLVRGERRLEMETGYGTESVLTDGWLKRMQAQKMVPHFKQGRYGAGLEAGVTASVERLRRYPGGITTGSSAPRRSAAPTDPPDYVQFLEGGSAPVDDSGLPWWLILFGAGAVATIGGSLIYNYKRDRTCPKCDVRMKMLSEDADDEYLTEGQQTEELIGAIDYQFFYCGECGFDRMLTDRKWFSGFSKCPSCRHKTLDVESTTTRRPTTSSTGRKRVTSTCMHCDHHQVRHITLPRVTRSSSSSSGGGFSGSGGGGGSFGGGSSGGGGAGSSW